MLFGRKKKVGGGRGGLQILATVEAHDDNDLCEEGEENKAEAGST